MSFRLPTTEEKADYVLAQFNRIAKGYDLANDVISMGMHHLWKKKAINALKIKPEGQYLDVCCGTGDLTIRIAGCLSVAGGVTGLDFAANMLELAKTRLEKERNKPTSQQICTTVSFMQGDAQSLPFPENHFDGAVNSFGLRNLTNIDKGLAEMERVVKPGGKVVNLDLGQPSNWLFTPFYYFYFRRIVPIIGQFLQKDKNAYTYLPRSLDTYASPEAISNLFKKANLTNIEYIPLAFGSVALHVGTKF